jgi:transcriptional regulator GlxA family with amidase domain
MSAGPASSVSRKSIGFLLIPDFALMSYASAIEPFRAANTLSGKALYSWHHISIDGSPARASNDVLIPCDYKVGDSLTMDRLFVCAGGNPAAFNHNPTLRWLRKLASRGLQIGGVSGGPYILARAGLLEKHRFTLHWEHIPALAEEFPHLEAAQSLYVIDRGRLTCAGGIAALDMMHELIEDDYGQALASAVSEWFLHTDVRLGSGPQRMRLRERFNVTSGSLLKALAFIEANLENPASRQSLAEVAGLSIRQLDRLFQSHLGITARSYYLRARLERARTLLRQTEMPILEISVAMGFPSASRFSKAFSSVFGHSPQRERRRFLSP